MAEKQGAGWVQGATLQMDKKWMKSDAMSEIFSIQKINSYGFGNSFSFNAMHIDILGHNRLLRFFLFYFIGETHGGSAVVFVQSWCSICHQSTHLMALFISFAPWLKAS